MKMTFDYELMKLYTKRYEKAMDDVLLDGLMHGGVKWLHACLSSIPVWAGASHGTFIKIAEKLGAIVTVSAISNIPGAKTAADGKSESTGNLIKKDGKFILEYKTTLWHLIYNEYKDGNIDKKEARVFSRLTRPGPYGFQDAGAEAFERVAKTVKLPNPWQSLKIVRRKV
jgi:hypothetical protein